MDGIIKPSIINDYVEVTADGVKTYGELITTLSGLIDYSRTEKDILLTIVESTITRYFNLCAKQANNWRFTSVYAGTNGILIYRILLRASSPVYNRTDIDDTGSISLVNITNDVPISGVKIRLYY